MAPIKKDPKEKRVSMKLNKSVVVETNKSDITPSPKKKKYPKTPISFKTHSVPTEEGISPKLKKTPKRLTNSTDSIPKKSLKKSLTHPVDQTTVKFANGQSPSSAKKKFEKTPHSSKTLLNTRVTEGISSTGPTNLKLSDGTSPRKKKVKKSTKLDFSIDNNKNSPAATPARKVKTAAEEKEAERLKRENTIFIGNLPATVDKKAILKIFSKFGKVLTVRHRCAVLTPKAKNRKAGVILKQVDEKSTYTAFIKFSELSEAKAALAMNGSVLKDHHLRVNLATENENDMDKNKAIFLRNMPYKLTEDELWNTFSSCGQIVSVRIMRSRENYKSRGMGYINFTDSNAVELAIKMNGTEISGRPISVYRWGKNFKYLKNEKKSKKPKKLRTDPATIKMKKSRKSLEPDYSGVKSDIKKKKKTKKLSADSKKKRIAAKLLAKNK